MFFKRLFTCKHQADTYNGVPVYGSLRFAGVDGMGIEHAEVLVRCGKCGEHFTAAMLHLPK
jgi:hypothetical protein